MHHLFASRDVVVGENKKARFAIFIATGQFVPLRPMIELALSGAVIHCKASIAHFELTGKRS